MKVVNHAPKMIKNKQVDRKISTCSICIMGIFTGQEYHWSRGKVCGLIHDLCEET